MTGLPRNTNTPFGRALTGEVEDYQLDVIATAVSEVAGMPADFDQDNDVDGHDFLTWQRNLGTTTGAVQSQGSVNGDGDVDGDDLAVWKQQFGESISASATGSGSGAAASVSAGTRSGSGLNSGTLAANALSQFKLGGDFTAFVASLSSASPTSAATSETATAQFDASARSGLANLVNRLRDAGERAKTRFDSIEEAASELADRVESFEVDSLRRDRAFEDLFGSRRRQGLRADLELELAEADGAAEAFAAIADHFEWRRD
ncbi:MAG: hypothetical protein H0T51_07315 [Pirellulales bacterium]|nr:hypothetical protein [Pirellulales bacterium]